MPLRIVRILLFGLTAMLLAATLDASRAWAQDTTRVLRDLGVQRDTIDTFQPQPYRLQPFILPGSVDIRLGAAAVEPSAYRIDYRSGRLWLDDDTPFEQADTLFAAYRTYPFSFDAVYRRRAQDSTRSPGTPAGSTAVAVIEDGASDDRGFDPFEGITLQRSGTISRGLVGGTNRDVTVESGLQMQLQGDIAEDVSVRAVLTDQNTPLQPEGTTQRLENFDRVFLELSAPQGTARLGDVDVDLGRRTQFAGFSRKLQGASLESDTLGAAAGLPQGRAQVVGAVSRGQFRSQNIEPIDGVQGPYRLTGETGRDRVVIVAGSEAVFLDGERLERGRTHDYVIDYTRGEITFTPDRIITDDRRITAEFQVRTSPFNRTLVASEAEAGVWRGGEGRPRLRIGARFIREADGTDLESGFALSREDSLRLARAGDDPAVRSGAEPVPFDAEAPFVQYRQTVVETPGGSVDTAYTPLDQEPEPGTPVYRVRFTDVGAGNGAYVRAGRQVNGILYEYRGPGQGRYAPVQPLPRPKRQQLFDLTASVEPVVGVVAFGEWAQSVNDRNRFSSLDEGDDRGQGGVVGLRLTDRPVRVGGAGLGRISATLRRQQRGAHFETFNTTRPIEFRRRWNLARRGSGLTEELQGTGREVVDRAALEWTGGRASRIQVEAGRLQVGDRFEALRRRVGVRLGEPGLPRLDARAEYVTSTQTRTGPPTSLSTGPPSADGIDGAWLRTSAQLRQPLAGGRVEPRLHVDYEERRQRARAADSLTRASFAFVEVEPGVDVRADALTASAGVAYRQERDAAGGTLQPSATAWTVESDVAYDPEFPFGLQAKGGYRLRRVRDFFRINRGRQDTESVIAQLDVEARPLNRAVEAEALYDAVTERTPTLQEVYIRTGPEIGQFVWRDVNDDGIQQVDEFIPETTPNEGAYVQSFVPSDSLESVVSLTSRFRLRLTPSRLLEGETWWGRALASVRSRSEVEVREESRTDAIADIYLLRLHRFRQPATTVEGQLRFKQEVDLFPQSPRYGLDVGWRQTRGLTERAAGSETRFFNRWQAEARWQPTPAWGLTLRGAVQTDRTDSEAFADTRSFNIRTTEAHPELAYQPGRSVRLVGGTVFARKTDDHRSRSARVVRVPLRVAWNRAGRFRVTANVEAAQVDLDGEARGLAQFELTDGRGPGRSYLWGVQGRYVINEYLRATLSYDGRAPAQAPVIHTARLQFSASF